ncbi:MAG: CHAD domain-containing protein [Steroidobacteraceae bacterium]|nr:CHAD domain-containing protein [Steroidobacteraceae bacterium]MDW8259396.1 CHAD domain-containing protein [Gammaproteobacteria bacterium]
MTSALRLRKALRENWRAWRKALRRLEKRASKSTRAVHAFRVATRRLWAIDAALRAASAKSLSEHRRLRRAMRAAGRLRDMQLCIAQLEALSRRSAAAGAIADDLRSSLRDRQRRTDEAVGRVRPRKIKKRFFALLPAAPSERDAARLLAHATARLEQYRRMLERDSTDCLPRPTVEQLHALRLQIKQARYLSECLSGLGSAAQPRSQSAASTLRNLQDALGRVTDQRMVLRTIRKWIGRSERRRKQAASLLAIVERRQRTAIVRALAQLQRAIRQ